jgi:hypothetical protein
MYTARDKPMVPASTDPSPYTRSYYITGKYSYPDEGAIVWFPRDLPQAMMYRNLLVTWAGIKGIYPLYWSDDPALAPVFTCTYIMMQNNAAHAGKAEWNMEAWLEAYDNPRAYSLARSFSGFIQAKVNETSAPGNIHCARVERPLYSGSEKFSATILQQGAAPPRDNVVGQPLTQGAISVMATDYGQTYEPVAFAGRDGVLEYAHNMLVTVPFFDQAANTAVYGSYIMLSPILNSSSATSGYVVADWFPTNVSPARDNKVLTYGWPMNASELEVEVRYWYYNPVTRPSIMNNNPQVNWDATAMFGRDVGGGSPIIYTNRNVTGSFRFNDTDKNFQGPMVNKLESVLKFSIPIRTWEYGTFLGLTFVASASSQAADVSTSVMEISQITLRFHGVPSAAHIIAWDERADPAAEITIDGRIDAEIQVPMTLQSTTFPSSMQRATQLQDNVSAANTYLIEGRLRTSNNLFVYNQDVTNWLSPSF